MHHDEPAVGVLLGGAGLAIEAIKFRMEEKGLKQKDLAPYLGGKSRVSEVLSGKRPLTVAMVRELSQRLHIPADLLIQQQEEHAEDDSADDGQAPTRIPV
jgi:HTH-type transcriptional regulator/antitoxin HigA